MTPDLFWTYALNLIINSLLTFLTMAFFVQLLIFVFRIRQPRLKAILLSLPLIKLAIDPFLYDFQNWALMHQMNPLEAETGSRVLSAMFCFPTLTAGQYPLTTGIRLSLEEGRTFSPADIAALTIPDQAVKGIILTAGTVSVVLFGLYLFRLVAAAKILSRTVQKAVPCKRMLQNRLLKDALSKSGSRIILSADIGIPCAFGVFRKWICLPEKLIDHLSQNEFEAIVAHELDHLRWHDGIVRAICQGICALFWWVPSGWWLNRLEGCHEAACDSKIGPFRIDRLDLASAIIKTLKANKSPTPLPMLSAYFVRDNLIAQRVQPLLEESFLETGKTGRLQTAITGLLALSLLLGRFWIF